MPHIHAVFPENPHIREFLKRNKRKICFAFSKQSGYPMEDIALFPRPIPPADMELTEGVLPLEFIIDSGSKTDTDQECLACAIGFKNGILDECHGATDIHF